MMIETLDPRASGARRLQGKVCIVTGAGQGIGRATARRFAAEGATVVIAERVAETAQETLEQLTDAGAQACSIIADISRFDEAFQARRWGLDAEAERRRDAMATEAVMLGRWFAALRCDGSDGG